jgi:hypothetical protein
MRVVVMAFIGAKPSRERAGDTAIHRNATMPAPKRDVTDQRPQEAGELASNAGAGRRERLEHQPAGPLRDLNAKVPRRNLSKTGRLRDLRDLRDLLAPLSYARSNFPASLGEIEIGRA